LRAYKEHQRAINGLAARFLIRYWFAKESVLKVVRDNYKLHSLFAGALRPEQASFIQFYSARVQPLCPWRAATGLIGQRVEATLSGSVLTLECIDSCLGSNNDASRERDWTVERIQATRQTGLGYGTISAFMMLARAWHYS